MTKDNMNSYHVSLIFVICIPHVNSHDYFPR